MIELGPRPALLLGLIGHPMTVAEIRDLIDRAVAVAVDVLAGVDDRLGGEAAAALRGLQVGGEAGLERDLGRLRSVGLAECVEVDGESVWSRRPW